MKLKTSSKFFSIIALMGLLVSMCPMTTKAVTPSEKEYTATMQGAYDIFIGNKTPVQMTEGKEVFLVYTVESVDKSATTSYQHGVVASDNSTEQYPYENGGLLKFSTTSGLLEEGNTYFIRFRMKNGSLEVLVVRDYNGKREIVSLMESYGDATDAYRYMGLWFGCGSVTAQLSHILCYDEKGNDLGIQSPVATIPPGETFQYDKNLQQASDIIANQAYNVAIYNAKKTQSKEIYFEYTVKSSDSKLYQTGVFSTTKPNQLYPHDSGYLLYEAFAEDIGNGYLLEPEASYIVKIVRDEENMVSYVQKTVQGKDEMYSFPYAYKTYKSTDPYVGLWFGEGTSYLATFELINMKCYDENGENLGVKCNQNSVNIVQKGEKMDYSTVQGTYYDSENQVMLVLNSDKTAQVTRDGVTKEYTYEIWENTIYIDIEDARETYIYTHQRIYSDTVIFDRLNTYYVEFQTGTEETVARQVINADTGFVAMKPEDPKKENATFEGWVLADGREYEFGSIVDESITLYAKWSDGAVYETAEGSAGVNVAKMTALCASVFLLILATAVSVVFLRGGRKHEASK